MPLFAGFPDGKGRQTPLPALFFTSLLPQIDHLAEMKVTLYAFWFLYQQEGHIRFITYEDFASDAQFVSGLGNAALELLGEGLERAVSRGTFLKVLTAGADPREAAYFLNTARGRAIVQGIQKGDIQLDQQVHKALAIEYERPNIFRLYEENIGPLTPLMSDSLRDAESTYPADWLEDAVKIAVQKNARNWRFIDAVLRSWKEKGRYETNKRGTEENRRKYIEGEYADFIEH